MSGIVVNHVMSQDIHSNILESFIDYLSKSNDSDCHITSVEPIDDADVYHYHRPHLEKKLLPKSIVTVHHDLLENDPWLSLVKFTERYKECSKVVCLNSLQQKTLSEYHINHTAVIPHGYNCDIFSDDSKLYSTSKSKITLGLISKRYGRRVKGEAYFVELVKRLDPNLFDFVLVGDGRSEEYYLLKDFGFEVKVFERLPYRVFASLYKSMDILLMLSTYEGGPANIPEAVISRVPVACFNIGMVPDFIKDNINGLILSGNVEDDSQRFMDLASNKENFKNLVDSTNENVPYVPTWEEVADMYNDVYLSVAG